MPWRSSAKELRGAEALRMTHPLPQRRPSMMRRLGEVGRLKVPIFQPKNVVVVVAAAVAVVAVVSS